jgi:hypothetical protein
MERAQALVLEALPLLRSLELGDESLKALMVLEQAAHGSQLSSRTLAKVRGLLEGKLDIPRLAHGASARSQAPLES